MKIGMNLMLWTFNPNFAEHEKYLDKLKNWGFDAFEVCISDLDKTEINKFAQKAVNLGMEPQCLDLFPVTVGDLIGKEPTKRKYAVDRIKQGCHKSRDMGAHVFSGPFFQGLNNSTDVGPTKEEWNWAVEGLRECAEEAKKCGILLAAEPLNRFEMHIVNTIDKAYQMCEEVGLDNMGILADTHHGNIEELNLVDAYVSHIDRIFNIHISENNRGIPGSGHGIPKELFHALKDYGYKGNLIIEAFNANVKEVLPLLRIWKPFAQSEDEIAIKGIQFIKDNLD
ncbi:MAG: sugar phosphate isomerase/epimerase [Anaerolineaceae bacterium]|nr:sugar phosphate isomerase/epimerase [Anaerolineaceae bacterium]